MSFINDSGVIIDDSLSPARRWLKEDLLIEQYAEIIRFTGIADDTFQRIEYVFIDEAKAIDEYDVLYGYLEDYGGGGGGISGIQINNDVTPVKSNVDEINFIYPIAATSAGINTVAVGLDQSSIPNQLMLEVAAFTQPSNNVRGLTHLASVDKLYVKTFAVLVIFDSNTYQQLAFVNTAGGGTKAFYIPSRNEIWTTTTNNTIGRVSPTTNAVLGSITVGGGAGSGRSVMIEYEDTLNVFKVFCFIQANVTLWNVVDSATLVNSSQAFANIQSVLDGALNMNSSSAMYRNIVITINGNKLTIIDCETLSTTELLNPSSVFVGVGNGAIGIVYAASIDRFIVCSVQDSTIVYLEPATATTFTVDKIIRSANSPQKIVLDEPNGVFFITCSTIPLGGNVIISKHDLITGECLSKLVTSTQCNNNTTNAIELMQGAKSLFASGGNTTAATAIVKINY